MDFSKISDADLEAAIEKALAAEDYINALAFQDELGKRAEKTYKQATKTSVGEQALTGVYEGIARGLGAPVDILTAGYEAATGREVEKPVGGSQSLRDLFQLLSGGEAMTDVEPQTTAQRVVRGGTEAVGEAIPAAATLAVAGPKAAVAAAPTLYQGAKGALAQVRTEAAKAPGMFAGTEAATAFTAGLAGRAVEEVLPDSPTAQFLGEIIGAIGGAKTAGIADRLITKAPSGPLTAEQMKREAGNLYELQKKEGLSAQPAVTENIFGQVFKYLDEDGFLEPVRGSNKVRIGADYAKLRPIYNLLEAYMDKGMTAANIQTLRRSISGRMDDAKGSEKNALRNVLRIFDANTAELAPEIQVANALYSKAMKADQVEELLELAKSRATSSNLDMENAIRTEFRPLLRRIIQGKERGWTQEERDQISQIVEGGSTENMLRFIGKFAPSGVVSLGVTAGLPYSMAYSATRDPAIAAGAAGATMAVGLAGRTAAARLQKQNVDRLYQSMIQGRDMTPASQQRLYAALTAYLAGQATTQ
jgi:hypothetical protein